MSQYGLLLWAGAFKNRWTEEEAAFRLCLALSPRAVELAEGTSECFTEVGYPEVIQHLANIFIPTDKIPKAATKLELWQIKPKESWQDYALDLTKLYQTKVGGGKIAQSLASLSMKRAAWVRYRLDPLVAER